VKRHLLDSPTTTLLAGSCAVLLSACVAEHTVVTAFPPGGMAAPWILTEPVWTGTMADAADALGSDADRWQLWHPTRVYLAVYRNEDDEARRLKVRCFEFVTTTDASDAFRHMRPVPLKPYKLGDEGASTGNGVLFRRGQFVFDIFGDGPAWGSEVQSALLGTHILKRLPAEAAGAGATQ
jgi:hypothetical protein